MTWQGTWSGSTPYAVNDAVAYNGTSYLSIQAGTNHQPDTITGFWSELAQKGDTGATGATGATGPQGPTGVSGTTNTYTSNGSTQYKIQKLTTVSSASRAIDATTSDTTGFVGIAQTTQSAGASVDVVLRGQSSCVFDGATTAGNYVQASSTTAGDCHDAGSTRPTTGQIVGRVLSTNGSAGTHTIEVFGLENVGAESTLTFSSPLSRSTNTISCSNCEQTGNKNAASGYAGLDASSKIVASHLPNPSSSTLGGIQSFAAQSNKWINAISTSGVPSATRPAVSDLSDGTTGTGSVVLTTSPTITTPTISGALGANL